MRLLKTIVIEPPLTQKLKRSETIIVSELITFRITKAKVKFGVNYLCGHECERSFVQLISIRKRNRRYIVGN